MCFQVEYSLTIHGDENIKETGHLTRQLCALTETYSSYLKVDQWNHLNKIPNLTSNEGIYIEPIYNKPECTSK